MRPAAEGLRDALASAPAGRDRRNEHGFKDQSDSYRTYGGVRYDQWCDHDPDVVRAEVKRLRAAGIRIRMETNAAGGYARAFVHPDDVMEASGLPGSRIE